MNLQLTKKSIYFTRHGESVFNVDNKVGGDPELSERGKKYSKVLGKFFKQELKNFDLSNIQILTSTMKRAFVTAKEINLNEKVIPSRIKFLDEINTGICDSISYSEIKAKFPKDFKERDEDKLRYRYPRGESYIDLIQRIEPVIFEIERAFYPVIVVNFIYLIEGLLLNFLIVNYKILDFVK